MIDGTWRVVRRRWLLPVLLVSSATCTAAFGDDAEETTTKIAIRNCSPLKVLVCAYDKSYNTMSVPRHAEQIKPGRKELFFCSSSIRCRIAVIVAREQIQGLFDRKPPRFLIGRDLANSATAIISMTAERKGTLWLTKSPGMHVSDSLEIEDGVGVLSANIDINTMITVGETVDGSVPAVMCQQLMRDQSRLINSIQDKDLKRTARSLRKRAITGRSSSYKNYKIELRKGVMALHAGYACW